jgi:hypothetical protein
MSRFFRQACDRRTSNKWVGCSIGAKKRVRDVFRRYVDEAVIERIESGAPLTIPITKKIINFAIIEIEDEDPAAVQKDLNTLVPLLLKNEGMVMGFSTVLFVSFNEEPKMWSGELSLALQSSELRVKGLYGRVEGWMGNWGGPVRMSYGPLIPGFGRLLARLNSLEYGSFEQA